MTNPLELLAYAVAIIVLVTFSLWIASIWLDRSDDAAAGIETNSEFRIPNSELPTSPWPAKHFISACMYCHHVTVVHGGKANIRVGDELRVSHGICDRCMADKHPEVAAIPHQLAHA